MSEPTGARRYGVGGGDAYYDAVRYGGYEGTREQFGRDQAEFAQNASIVAEAKETVERDTEEVRNTKNTFENTTVPEAIRALEQESEDQILAITQKGEEVSQQVETVGTEQKDAVANEGRARVRAVEQAGTGQVQIVNDAGTTQVGNVNQAGEDQIDAVEQAGADQVQAVTDEGGIQVQRVQDKGDEVLESIPSDYTALNQEVDDLKESTSVIEEKVDLVTSASDATESEIYLRDGTTTTNSAYRSTDFIPCSDYSELEYYLCGGTSTTPAMALLAFFNTEKQFVYAVGAIISNGWVESATPVPANAAYVKALCRISGTTLVPYVRGIKKNTIQSKISDLSVDALSQLEEVQLPHVFDDPVCYSNPTTPISGGTGSILRRMSRKVDCSNFDTIKYGLVGISNQLMIIFYDENLSIVGYKYGLGTNLYQEGEVSVPNSAKYVSGQWLSNSTHEAYIIGVDNNTANIKANNLYVLDDVSPSYTEEVVNINMTREQFVAAFDAKRQDYADLCLASIRGFVQMYGTQSFEEAYSRINRFFRREVYVEGISKKLLYDRINAAFTIPIRRFQDAKINTTTPCDFSFQIGEGQGGEPSLIVSADGGELWAYSYGSRYTSTDGTTWGDKTNQVRSDGARAPQHQGLSVVDETIFMFGRDPDGAHNLKMYTSPLTDGVNFTYRGVPLSIGHDFGDGLNIDNWGNSFLTKVDGTYYLFIEGRQDNDGNFWDIYCVTCTDPFVDNGDGTIGNWQNCGVAPVIANTNRSIANGNPSIAVGPDNRPIRIDGKYFMYYHQTNHSYSYILRAYSYDLINWTYESAVFDNRNKPTAGENQSSNADHSLIEFKGRTYFAYTHDINTTRTPHLMMMIDDRPFREILKLRP